MLGTPPYMLGTPRPVQASDNFEGGARTATATVLIFVTDVNDNSPVFSAAAFAGAVAEGDAVGSRVLRLFAADADTVGAGLTFSVSDGSNNFDIGEFLFF